MTSRLKATLLAATYLTAVTAAEPLFVNTAALPPWTPDAPESDYIAIPVRMEIAALSGSGAISSGSVAISGTSGIFSIPTLRSRRT